MAQILVTKPGVLDQRDKSKLRRAGIVTVEADDPADVKLINPEGSELSGSALLYAAMAALNTGKSYASDAREAFAKAILAEMETARQSERTGA